MRPEPPAREVTRAGGSVGGTRADRDADELQLGVTAAARRLGIAPATLRTWDRRYGLGPSAHVPGRHRRYSAQDLARLDAMRRALLRGASAAEAARYARAATSAAVSATGTGVVPEPRLPPVSEPTGRASARIPATRRQGGGPLRLGAAGTPARGLARAAMALDADAVRALLVDVIADAGVVTAWDEVVRPVLGAVSQRWAHSGAGVEVEHLLSGCVQAVFGARAGTEAARERPPVLVAGTPGEQHVLPIVALSAALAERGIGCRPLGADLPAPALASAVRRVAPAAVVLWSQLAETADVDVLAALPRTRPRYRAYVGGPGWTGHELPPRVVVLESLGSALAEISRVVSI